MEDRIETIKIISQRVGGIVFESDDEDDKTWVNMDKSKSKELKEKIKDLKKGDKVKVNGYDKEGKSYYTDIELVEEAEPEEIDMAG